MTRFALALAAASTLAACGSQSTKEQAPVQAQDQGVNVASEVDADTAKVLPTMIVAKVPVDAQGNELVDQGVAHEVFGAASVEGGASAEAAFAQGTQVTIADELDRDSSTSQWGGSYYWNTPWYPGKLLGRGLWWGRNPYVNYGGASYGYSYSSYYRYNNCNYYYYRPAYNYGSGYGYGY